MLALSALAACSTRLDRAPVVDRSGAAISTDNGQLGQAVPLGPAPPGYYRVKPGDTLYRIALENGQNYRNIATWNNLTNPNQIEVDQLLRVAPPGANVTANGPGVSTAPIGGPQVQTQSLNGASTTSSWTNAPAGASAAPAAVAPGANAAVAQPQIQPQQPQSQPQQASPPAPAAAGNVTFAWPAHGPILNRFDGTKNKGIDIGGNAGDPVRAAAAGRVVYAGNGLRGYGNLIIIKHDATYLTAYAHNRALLVKEGDVVTKGQKIAEMGNSDSNRVLLHFEVRRQGKPVDPLKYLPPQ